MELVLAAVAVAAVAICTAFRIVLDIRWRRKVNARLRAMNTEPTDDH